MLGPPGAAAGVGRAAFKDVVDRTAENDPEYQKVVREIQQGAARNFLMGASDRQDLQYIAEFRDAEHMKEMEVQQAEANEFAHLRSRLEGSDSGTGGPRATPAAAVQLAVRERKEIKPADKLLPAIKVLPSRDSADAPGRALKRARTTSTDLGDVPLARARTASTELAPGAGTASLLPAARVISAGELASPVAAAASGRSGSGALDGQVQVGAAAAQQQHEQDQAGAELQGLLGGYGSSDDDDGGGGQQNEGAKLAGSMSAGKEGQQGGIAGAGSLHSLPSAAELLGGVWEDSPATAQPAVQGQGAQHAQHAAGHRAASSSDDGASSSDGE